jgi:microcystin-dependent protein
MSEPFLGEIKMFGFNFAPRGWAFCDGQILPINQNQSLYSLLGTTFGGDGRTTFALPDLRGRIPLHVEAAFPLGQRGGEETHSLAPQEMPSHTHAVVASAESANQATAQDGLWANSGVNVYRPEPDTLMSAGTVSMIGQNAGHENRPPHLVLSFCIALQGLFPSRN